MAPLVCRTKHHSTLDTAEAWTTDSPGDEDDIVTRARFTRTDDTITGAEPAPAHLTRANDSEVRLAAILT
jgi:hypothetical protein